MRAMIWKELRENGKWAVLGMLGVSLANAYMLSQYFGSYEGYSPFRAGGLPMPTTITSPVVGILLGFLQILPELRRDQWAFLLHRPVPRATLFWGKVVAGLLLFLLATVPPFVGAVLWLATPGRIAAPFDWRMALAGIADILSGIVFYLGGLLTALRPARWYGSRALGIAAAAFCVLLVSQVHEFWQALVVIGLGAFVLFVAARGSFLASGEYEGQPKVAKAALGTTLFTGSAVACYAAIGFIITIVGSFTPRDSGDLRTEYKIDTAGRILRVTYEGGSLKKVTNVSGKPVPWSKTTDDSVYGGFLNELLLVTPGKRQPLPSYRNPTRYYVPLDRYYEEGVEVLWYYDRDQGVVPGYSRRDKHLVGYLTPGAFIPVGEADTLSSLLPFQGPLLNSEMWLSGNVLPFPGTVYRLDLGKRRVTHITTAESGHSIRAALEAYSVYSRPRSPGAVVVATETGIQAYTPSAKPLLAPPLPYDAETYTIQVSVTPDQDHLFFWYRPSQAAAGNSQALPSYIVEASWAKGERWAKAAHKPVLKRHVLPPLPPDERQQRWQESLVGLAVPPGLLIGLTGYTVVGDALGNEGARGMLAQFRQDRPLFFLLFAFSLLSSVVCAVLAYLVGRRCAFTRAALWAWVLGVLLSGPFGLLTLLSLHDWPARETCASCSKRRVVNRERCEHCGTEFLPPPRDGTEIFEPVG